MSGGLKPRHCASDEVGALLARDMAAGRVYLRPVGPAASMPDEALPLAGGPLRFAACQVLVRDAEGVAEGTVSLSRLRADAKAAGHAAAARVEGLLSEIARARPSFAGLDLSRPRVMGIVNTTPDSFSDGGAQATADDAVAHGQALRSAGADIVDVGGESTRPGADPVSESEETARALPVIERLADGNPLSIDTRRASVMRAALDAGATVINDVSALTADAASLAVAADSGAPVVLTHMRGDPKDMNRAPYYEHAALDVYDYLDERVSTCVAAGIPRERIAVDPGFGFGKAPEHNAQILAMLALLHGLGCVVVIGASRKSFDRAVTRHTRPRQRLGASLAAALAGCAQGAQVLRVHDVAETAQAVAVWRRVVDAETP